MNTGPETPTEFAGIDAFEDMEQRAEASSDTTLSLDAARANIEDNTKEELRKLVEELKAAA